MSKIRVKLIRGLAGKNKRIIKIINALGFRKTNQEKVFEKNDAILGMIKKAFYMFEVKEE